MNSDCYRIKDWHIFDVEGVDFPDGLYIREILDTSSYEYFISELTPKQKLSIILELGLDQLIKVLEDCYSSNNKPFNALDEGNLAYAELMKSVKNNSES